MKKSYYYFFTKETCNTMKKYFIAFSFLLVFMSACFADTTSILIEKKYVSKYKLIGSKSFLDGIEPINIDGTINVVVEIPAGTIEKWEVSKSDGSIIWDFLDGNPRSINYKDLKHGLLNFRV
jgi:inorganic pyrophosphatase